ncbi:MULTISPECIES: hypothetical protein [unclassified Salinibacterium]|uniref:hypothetical protein n=1 Tax=unclassified Salinibacterium TaxID=2632331 RepID=UPI00174C76E1|nr:MULTISPECIES: hypothetical protein [unclassified Salinibacterium]
MSDEQPQHTPTRREKTRPLELIGMAAVFGIFVGAMVFMGSRQWDLTLIFAGVAFVASLVILATLLIAAGPKYDQERVDPVDPDAPTGSAGSVHRDPHR